MKIAIVTDANSGITKEEAKELGVYIVPMPFTIDGKDYYDGKDLDIDMFYQKQEAGSDIYTSQPSPASVIEVWQEALKENEVIVHIPMSSSLSATCETAMMLANEEEFEGKVFVVDNKRISMSQRASVIKALNMVKKGETKEKIIDFLNETSALQSIYLTVDNLKYLKKGGRISAAAHAIGTLLKIKPVLKFKGEKIDSCAKARTPKQAKQIILENLKNDIINDLKEENVENVAFYVSHSNAKKEAEEFALELKEYFNIPNREIKIFQLSLSISTHVGPKTLAVGIVKRDEYLGE